MIITFQDSLLRLHAASRLSASRQQSLCAEALARQLDDCFDRLIAGQPEVEVRIEADPRRVADYLHHRFRMVKAAGGLVTAPTGECLMILRDGHWDLPKGMVEHGETLRQAALREVEEETGVQALPHPTLITKTYHIYDKYGGWHLKQTSWYAMRAQRSVPRPQTEEAISQAVWTQHDECLQRLGGSYRSLQILAQAYIQQKHAAS